MADFNSKYTGEQVEQLLDQVASGNAGGGGGITEEIDPIFSASPSASITEEKKTEWDNKQDAISDLAAIREGAALGATALQTVPSGYATTSDLDGKVDKISGKALSTEDFTTALKTKLEGLSNYDDTELSEALSTLRGDFDKLVSGDTTTAIKTFNEVIAFLDGIQDTQDLSGIIASIEQQIAGKMDKVTLATVATSGSYDDLSNKPTIPTKLSELDNDDGYVQRDPNTGFVELNDRVYVDEHAIVAHAFKDTQSKAYMLINSDGGITTYNSNDDSALKISVNGSGDKFLADNGKYKTALTEHQDISGKQDVLVSGTNIKTINGTSLLGSGDIVISGGGGGGYDDTEIKGQISDLEATIGDINTILESIIGNSIITFTIGDTEYQAEQGMTWETWVNSKYNTAGEYIVNTYNNTIIRMTSTTTAIVMHENGTHVHIDEIILKTSYSLAGEGSGGQ
ncbi:MAG: hypothetical protein J6Q60_01050 [Bacteroidaceae bacterium]|nr:hypothetical protein [Bacteroidaceae bacterium]